MSHSICQSSLFTNGSNLLLFAPINWVILENHDASILGHRFCANPFIFTYSVVLSVHLIDGCPYLQMLIYEPGLYGLIYGRVHFFVAAVMVEARCTQQREFLQCLQCSARSHASRSHLYATPGRAILPDGWPLVNAKISIVESSSPRLACHISD